MSNWFSDIFKQSNAPQSAFNYLNTVAGIESSYNPNAVSSSGASGVFQFTKSTASRFGLANRFDPVSSTNAAYALMQSNNSYLSKTLGRIPTEAELYLAHQQGASGAAALLSNPSASAVSILGTRAVTSNGGNASMTAGEFAGMWINKYNSKSGDSVASTGQQSWLDWTMSFLKPNPLDAETVKNWGNLSESEKMAGINKANPGFNILGTVQSYFIAFVVIVLGFIFVAAGLYMFRGRD